MFLRREIFEIGKIKKIQMGLMGGLYKSLLLIYSENGSEKNVKIITATFKKDTLKQFILDLKKQNYNIEIEESVDKFLSSLI